ncbi:unnamed protein product [Adineta ricciae]|uniref:Uncharacterized protein n=1 Tax=Adineta ricciae TaxID=249248 RepID=A0A815SFF3_ADIRI|nr:unnamed protein product [Adineta ricciae]CAF1491238.1 unnamed protein product [Adineta ricciae]
MIVCSLHPSLVMFLFGCATLHRIRYRRRIQPSDSQHNYEIHRTNRQLLHMLTLQVVIVIVSTSSFYLYKLHRGIIDPFDFFVVVNSTMEITQVYSAF